MAKIYKIKTVKGNRENVIEGDLNRLKEYFRYTFEVGSSWNNKINTNPKTIKSFISNLKKSYEEKEGHCYRRTSVTLVK